MEDATIFPTLSDCPFCGGAAFYQKYVNGFEPPAVTWRAQCRDCRASPFTSDDDTEWVAEQWNQRVING